MSSPSARAEASTSSTADDPLVARIEALRVNRAHRATARAYYLDVEATIERVTRMLANCRRAANRMFARRGPQTRAL